MARVPGEGDRFGPYELKEQLGQGGMGTVFRAFDTEHGRSVALKLLVPTLATDPVFRERFLREAHMAAGLTEPHVLPIHRFGDTGGILFIDMRLASGYRSLADILSAGPMAPAVAVAVISQIAAALDDAHGHGLVHRDVKPANILVGPGNFAYLIDFGIAHAADDERLTEPGSVMGTRAYMAPERFTAGYRDAPTADTYALACVLHKALTGSVPQADASGGPVGAVVVDPAIPHGLASVIGRALDPDPARRPGSAGDLATEALQQLSIHEQATVQQIVDDPDEDASGRRSTRPVTRTTRVLPGGSAQPVTPSPGPSRSGRRRFVWGAAAVVLLMVAAVAYITLRPSHDGEDRAVGSPSQASAAAAGGSQPETPQASTSATAVVSGGSTATTASLSEGSCVDSQNRVTPCSASGSGVVVADPDCTTESVRTSLGYDTLLSPMLQLSRSGDRCVVYPAKEAAAAGAGAAQIKALSGHPSAKLLACTASASGSGAQIPCSRTHRLEFVGGWMTPPDDLSVDSVCAVPAQTYSGRTFDGTDQSFTVQLLQSGGDGSKKVRCAIASRKALTGSLWHRGATAP